MRIRQTLKIVAAPPAVPRVVLLFSALILLVAPFRQGYFQFFWPAAIVLVGAVLFRRWPLFQLLAGLFALLVSAFFLGDLAYGQASPLDLAIKLGAPALALVVTASLRALWTANRRGAERNTNLNLARMGKSLLLILATLCLLAGTWFFTVPLKASLFEAIPLGPVSGPCGSLLLPRGFTAEKYGFLDSGPTSSTWGLLFVSEMACADPKKENLSSALSLLLLGTGLFWFAAGVGTVDRRRKRTTLVAAAVCVAVVITGAINTKRSTTEVESAESVNAQLAPWSQRFNDAYHRYDSELASLWYSAVYEGRADEYCRRADSFDSQFAELKPRGTPRLERAIPAYEAWLRSNEEARAFCIEAFKIESTRNEAAIRAGEASSETYEALTDALLH